jgi:hypothetical protein
MSTVSDGAPHTDDDGMTMPWVCVESVGGAWEDEAFQAGYTCGRLHSKMRTTFDLTLVEVVPAELVQQLDLCAMDAGWVITDATPTEDPTFTTLRLAREQRANVSE